MAHAPLTYRATNVLTGLVLLAIAVATLAPTLASNSHGLDVAPADLVRNLLFFVPFGVCLGLRGDGVRTALAAGVGVSVAIEIAQLGVVGRTSSPWDVAGNGVGALAGWAVVTTWRFWLFPSPAISSALGLTLGLAAAAVFWANGKSAQVMVPFANLYAHLPTATPNLAPFSGRDLAAWLDGRQLPPRRIYDAKPVRAALSGDFDLRLTAALGEPASGPMNFFMLATRSSSIVTLEIDNTDLLYRFGTRASRAEFEPRAFRLEGLLEGVHPGDRIELRVSRRGPETCVSRGKDQRCGIGSSAADGWALFVPHYITDRLSVTLLRWAWLALFFLPIGYWLGRSPVSWLGLAIAVGSMLFATRSGTLLPFSWDQALPTVLAVGGGHVLRRLAALLEPDASHERAAQGASR